MLRRSLGTLPNLLSLSRIALAAAFVMMPGTRARIWLIVAAAITDFLDGWIARRVDATSRWGALLDPITDRVFVLAAVATFVVSGALGTTQYFVLILRDLATAIGFVVARSIPWLRTVNFRARPLGKIVTTLQLATLAAVLVRPTLVQGFVIAVGATSVLAIADYTRALWTARHTPA